MELKDFQYDLPQELIAQHPAKERASSRLMVLDRSSGKAGHKTFSDLAGYLKEGDLLILNDTKVIPARIFGRRPGGGLTEFLLVSRAGGGEVWESLARSSKGLRTGARIFFDSGVEAVITGKSPQGNWLLEFNIAEGFLDRLEELGRVPLPPYIKREPSDEDKARYQTVFAGSPGAVAAPTAGLHFTWELLDEIKRKGVMVRSITLHTGPGTFMPVRTEKIEDHKVLSEYYKVGTGVYEDILSAKKDGRRVVAVGTTATRALESTVIKGLDDPALEGFTGLFIYPGFKFRAVDVLITNFHLPGSTLIMLVCAFAGRQFTLDAYKEAVAMGYRFYSYGDAMLII